MLNIPPEKARERFDALPEHLKEVLFAEKSIDVVWGLGESNHLTEERTKQIADLTGAVILGFIHPEDLAKEFQKEINLPAQVTSSIAEEINKKILAPIIEEVRSLYHWGEVRAPAAPVGNVGAVGVVGSVPPPTSPEPEVIQHLKPIFREEPNVAQAPIPGSPFMLHEETEPERAEPRGGTPSLARPYFFKEDQAPAPTEQKPISARLEVDEETTAYPYTTPERKPPKVGKTKEPQIRVVHYTGPSTPLRPEGFEGQAQVEPTEPGESDIHPNNVVNLKDLPK